MEKQEGGRCTKREKYRFFLRKKSLEELQRIAKNKKLSYTKPNKYGSPKPIKKSSLIAKLVKYKYPPQSSGY